MNKFLGADRRVVAVSIPTSTFLKWPAVKGVKETSELLPVCAGTEGVAHGSAVITVAAGSPRSLQTGLHFGMLSHSVRLSQASSAARSSSSGGSRFTLLIMFGSG